MTIARFLTYITYSTDRPADVGSARWNGMIRWAKKRGYIS